MSPPFVRVDEELVYATLLAGALATRTDPRDSDQCKAEYAAGVADAALVEWRKRCRDRATWTCSGCGVKWHGPSGAKACPCDRGQP